MDGTSSWARALTSVRAAWVHLGWGWRIAALGTICLALGATTQPEVPLASGIAVATLVPAALVDRHQQRLPDPIVGLAAALFVIAAFGAMAFGAPVNLAQAIAGLAVFTGPLLLLHLMSPASMGFGDVKAAAVIGLAIGAVHWQLALAALAVATGIAAVAGIAARADTIALGPALVVAAALALTAPNTFTPIDRSPTNSLPNPAHFAQRGTPE